MLKKIFIGLVIVMVMIQFFRPQRNLAAESTHQEIEMLYAVPAEVQQILKRSCNDCHSNQTVYPWYSSIQPVGWWLQDHIDEGKQHLNFSLFGSYSPQKQAHKLEEVIEEVKEGGMPLKSYTFIHRNAVLKKEEAVLLTQWSDRLRQQIIKQYNLPQ